MFGQRRSIVLSRYGDEGSGMQLLRRVVQSDRNEILRDYARDQEGFAVPIRYAFQPALEKLESVAVDNLRSVRRFARRSETVRDNPATQQLIDGIISRDLTVVRLPLVVKRKSEVGDILKKLAFFDFNFEGRVLFLNALAVIACDFGLVSDLE